MSLLATFENDPFFSGIDLPRALALEHRSFRDNVDRQVGLRGNERDFFESPFRFMQTMMNDMGQMIGQMESRMHNLDMNGQDTPNGVAFSSSTVMSYDGRNPDQPRVFQATSEKLRGPEGLERTRKAVRDTGRNLEKMEVAHRLGNRGHRITKELDPNSGRFLENRLFEHIDNEQEFEREWFDRADKVGLKNLEGYGFDSSTNRILPAPPRALEHSRSHSQNPSRAAIEELPSNHSQSRHRDTKQRSNL